MPKNLSGRMKFNGSSVSGTSCKFFLTELSYFDIHDAYIDLRLSCYGLQSVSSLTPQRFLLLKDFSLAPGFGKGSIEIAGQWFGITYAWKGLSEGDADIGGKDYHKVLTYTVRVEGEGLKAAAEKLLKDILIAEHGSDQLELSRQLFLKRMSCKPANMAGYRKMLQEKSDYFRKRLAETEKKHPGQPNSPQYRQREEDIKTFSELIMTPEEIEKKVREMAKRKTVFLPILGIQKIEPWQTAKKISTAIQG
ncbi:MAG: hypothetical protein K2Y39_04755 [Candidatus Obscuribacterales bacterium]|nr:hypothetical protein [Candidatus Obscuribacterales bacterium]